MTVGSVHTTSLTPGIHVPKWGQTPLSVQQWLRGSDRQVKSSIDFTNTMEVTSPLRILGASDGRRVRSSLHMPQNHKRNINELTSLTLKGVYSPDAKKSMEPLPFRAAMTKAKQVPGRYFPKAMLTDEQKAVVAGARPKKIVPVQKDHFPPIKGLDFIKNSVSLLSSTNRSRSVQTTSYNAKIAKTRKSLRTFPEAQTEVFAICFQGDVRGEYDPDSELHSDYYSIKRVNMNSGKELHTTKTHVNVPTVDTCDFRVVLRGQRKRLHERADDRDIEPEVGKSSPSKSVSSLKGSQQGFPRI